MRVGGDIREPTRIVYVDPVYPEIAKQARVSGVVILEAIIDPSGNVTNLSVLRSIPLLDQAAIDAVRQWRVPAHPAQRGAGAHRDDGHRRFQPRLISQTDRLRFFQTHFFGNRAVRRRPPWPAEDGFGLHETSPHS